MKLDKTVSFFILNFQSNFVTKIRDTVSYLLAICKSDVGNIRDVDKEINEVKTHVYYICLHITVYHVRPGFT